MKVKELLTLWEATASDSLTKEYHKVRLPVKDAARLQALAELYPRRTMEELITDLLGAALDELEGGMPYISGNKVVATDELGDPLYEDIGPTPRYLSLTEKYLNDFRRKGNH